MRFLAALLVMCALAPSTEAHAYSFKLYSVIVSGEAGVRVNSFRQSSGTRRTPAMGAEGGINVELVVFAPKYYPSRVSLIAGIYPDAQASFDTPTTGRHPGIAMPLVDPGIVKDFALGGGVFGGARYRWETAYAFVPFVEGGVFARGHKPISVAPPHLNVGLRAGGGLEYWLMHRVGLFLGVHLQGGPRLYPLNRLLPMPEVSTEFLAGVRGRAF